MAVFYQCVMLLVGVKREKQLWCPREILSWDCFITPTSLQILFCWKMMFLDAFRQIHLVFKILKFTPKLMGQSRGLSQSLVDCIFVLFVRRQIKWVSCHENTQNNIINHELLIWAVNLPPASWFNGECSSGNQMSFFI